jgi:hypothetical protein
MEKIPAGILSIPPEFLDSAGFRGFRPESVGEWKVLHFGKDMLDMVNNHSVYKPIENFGCHPLQS